VARGKSREREGIQALLAGIRRIKLLGLIVAIVGALIAFLYWLAAPPYVPLVSANLDPAVSGRGDIRLRLADRGVRPARCQAAIDSPAATVIWVIAYLKLSCRTGSTRAILEDNVKPSAPLVVAGVLGCALIAGCVQTQEASEPSPPATSYQVGSFELQDSGSPQKVRNASVTSSFLQIAKTPTLLGRGFIPGDYGSGKQQDVM
jgi:hypothetical protein